MITFKKVENRPNHYQRNGRIQNFILELEASGMAIAEVNDSDRDTIKNLAVTIKKSALSMNKPHITAYTCNGVVYVENKLIKENES